jgi:hypothetical protein
MSASEQAPSDSVMRRVSILQTGRLGDLWYTVPLAQHLSRQGWLPEVVYDEDYGNPFSFFPEVSSRPVPMRKYFPDNHGIAHLLNESVWQLYWFFRLRREGGRIVWRQVFPFRWLQAHFSRVPYVTHWYRCYPDVDYRHAAARLDTRRDGTILVFRESQSISFDRTPRHYQWIDRNLDSVVERTGLRPVVIAYGDQPDHQRHETWRGTLDEYQQRVASCSAIFGIVTSGHVLGQLLGKPTVALYSASQSIVDTIGGETVALRYENDLTHLDLARIVKHVCA